MRPCLCPLSVARLRPFTRISLLGGAAPTEEEARLWQRGGVKTKGQTCWFNGKFNVTPWGRPTGTVIGAGAGNGGGYVADPRVDMSLPPGTCGGAAVADPRVLLTPPSTRGPGRFDVFSKHEVTPWGGPSRAVIVGEGNGASAVQDPRLDLLGGERGWHHGAVGAVSTARAVAA